VAAEDIAYKYTGGDPEQAHHSGIPARDLTADEVKGLDKEHRETLRHSAIYEKVESAPARPAPKPADEKPEAHAPDKK
jgi:hypothetical protein